jgi:hypothetical protein
VNNTILNLFIYSVSVLVLNILVVIPAKSSDHADTPVVIDAGRNDARITDMYAFTKDNNLVLILAIDPTVPMGVKEYQFPTDVVYTFNIDNDSEVTPNGTIVIKNDINEDIVIKIRFNDDGSPDINGTNTFSSYISLPFFVLFSCASSDDISIEESITNFFSGPRDDPFIRGPRIGKNVAAIVLELPLENVIEQNSTILIWATAKVDGLPGDFQERFGTPFTSQLNTELNSTHPKDDFKNFGIEPDVMVLNTNLPSGFPNGRLLEDDVVDIVCPGVCDNVLETDAPFPSENDVPFLQEFPFLSPPH